MNRRNFLKLGIASAVSVAALRNLPDDYEIPKQIIVPDDELFYRMTDISIYGRSTKSRIAHLSVARPNGDLLLEFSLNTYGGMLRYVPYPGAEFFGPVKIISDDPDVRYEAIFRRDGEIKVVAG